MHIEDEIVGIKEEIKDIKDNHLGSIYNAVIWIDAKMERLEKRFYRILGLGIGTIAIVLAILEVLG